MTEQPWGAGEGAPMNEGSEDTAVGPGRWGERRAAAESAPAGTPTADGDELPWGEAEAVQPGPADLGTGQPTIEPDPPVDHPLS